MLRWNLKDSPKNFRPKFENGKREVNTQLAKEEPKPETEADKGEKEKEKVEDESKAETKEEKGNDDSWSVPWCWLSIPFTHYCCL